MPGLVQQRADIRMAEQRRRIGPGGREIAHHIGDRQLHMIAVVAARTCLAHPCAAALAGPREQVEIQTRNRLAALVDDIVEARIGMVERGIGARLQADAEQPFEQCLPALHHLLDREIAANLGLVDRIERLTQPVRSKADVPGLQVRDAQLLGGKGFELIEVALRRRFGARGEIAQEGEHRTAVRCHLGGERPFDRIGKAEQPRRLAP